MQWTQGHLATYQVPGYPEGNRLPKKPKARAHRHPSTWGPLPPSQGITVPSRCPGAHVTEKMFRASLWLTTKELQGLRMLLALCSAQKVHIQKVPLIKLPSLQCTGQIGDGGRVSALLSGSGDCASDLIVTSLNRFLRGVTVCKRGQGSQCV